jgi:hypothetical protein
VVAEEAEAREAEAAALRVERLLAVEARPGRAQPVQEEAAAGELAGR